MAETRPEGTSEVFGLTINKEQLHSFAELQRTRYEERLYRHVKDQFPEELRRLGECRMRAKLVACIEEGCAWGILSEQGLAFFTDASIALGTEKVTAVPGTQSMLQDDDLDGNTKARRLCDMTILYLDLREEIFQ